MLLAGLAVVAVAVGALLGRTSLPQPSSSTNETALPATESEESMSVHVSGMVMAPGVVDIAAGSIVADAIAAAGGLRTGAALETLNLAAPVVPGDHIVVPGVSDGSEEGDDPAAPGANVSGVVSLNQATASELETLPGVGPVLAERIVAWRDENGPFRQVEDLLEVSGIGESKLSAMRDLVRP